MRKTLAALTASSAIVAFVGGVSLAILQIADPSSSILLSLTPPYRTLLIALLSTAILGSAYAWITWPLPTSMTGLSSPPKVEEVSTSRVDVVTAFRQMRTYVDLEMWELALDKANYVLAEFPESKEAQAVSKTINDLRWKAEPKFVLRPGAPIPPKEPSPQGTEQMLKHVRTYMELEMWELAKQKAVALLKHFPDSSEAAQVAPLYQEIEKKLQPAGEKKE